MVNEDLVVRLSKSRPPGHLLSSSDYYLSRAAVTVTYTLRADHDLTVPVVFPVLNEPRSVRFVLNGSPIATSVTSDLQLYPAYEQDWIAAIERYLSADPLFAGLRAEARQIVGRRAAARPGEPRERRERYEASSLESRAQRRLEERSIPEAMFLSRVLSNYLLGSWQEEAAVLEPAPPERIARLRLRSERLLAVALDPKVADPAALWSTLQTRRRPIDDVGHELGFISAQLPLRQGDNELQVAYEQAVSFINASHVPPKRKPGEYPRHIQASEFEFILRTARFWRSFGHLQVTVYLPPGTMHASCNLPGAAISIRGLNPKVTCATRGLPDQNLAVIFSGATVSYYLDDDLGRHWEPAPAAPTRALKALWDRPLDRGGEREGPLVDGERVFVAAGERVAICDRTTGAITKGALLNGEVCHLLLLPQTLVGGFYVRNPRPYEPDHFGLVGLDRQSCALRWHCVLPIAWGHAYYPRPLAAGGVVVGWARGGPVFAVDGGSGSLLWRQDGEFRGAVVAADGSTVYLAGVTAERKDAIPREKQFDATVAEVIALDPATAAVKWRSPAGYDCSVPALWGDRLVAVGSDKRLEAHYLASWDRPTGKLLWKKALDSRQRSYNEVLATHAQDGRLLVFHDQGIDAYDLTHPPSFAWQVHYAEQVHEDPTVTERFAYVPNGRDWLQQYDLRTGKLLAQLRCAHFIWDSTISGDQLFTMEWSGLLTAWSLVERAPRLPAPPLTTPWPGVPPSDLAEQLARTGSPAPAP